MTLINKTLDILFRRIDPEEIIRDLFQKDNRNSKNLKYLFMGKAEATFSGYSYEEKANTYHYFFGHRECEVWRAEPYQLRLIAKSAAEMIEWGSGHPVCRYQNVLEWRDAYLLLGQDLFTTSWLAHESLSRPLSFWFSWPAIILVNNPILKQITSDLTIWSFKRRILYATYIRALLFKRIHSRNMDTGKIMADFNSFHVHYTMDEWMCQTVLMEAEGLRYLYGSTTAYMWL